MSEFLINIQKTRSVADRLSAIGKDIGSTRAQVNSAVSSLKSSGFGYLDAQLGNDLQSLDNCAEKYNSLSGSLQTVADTYLRTEESILNLDNSFTDSDSSQTAESYDFSSLMALLLFAALNGVIPGTMLFEWLMSLFHKNKKKKKKKSVLDSILFDDKGSYGGNQGKMESDYGSDPARRKELERWLREYFPNMTDKECYEYLDHLNSTGCAYTALANTIFMQFENDPKGFEKTFGFPMYGEDGDLNYDRLLLDLYVSTDKAGICKGSDGKTRGFSASERSKVLDNYLKDKGISATVTNIGSDPNDIAKRCKNGEKVIIGLHDDRIYNDHHSQFCGGHCMVVTGVTDDGKQYIVSSWGEQYYIDVDDIDGNDIFQTIEYK